MISLPRLSRCFIVTALRYLGAGRLFGGVMIRFVKAVLLGLAGLFLVACGLHVAQSGQSPLPDRPAQSLRLATLNVHYIVLNKPTGAWSVADWQRRSGAMDAAFKAMDADIVAFQEMESFAGGNSDDVNLARSSLLERNPGYRAAAIGDWRSFPSTQPIFFRADRLTLRDQGWFFFSQTPDVIYSRTFNGSFPAFASWALFADQRSGQLLRVVNVHFEYKSRSNRHLSAALVRDRLRGLMGPDEAVALLGDLNDIRGSRTQTILSEAGLVFPPVAGATYHLNAGLNLVPAIDHIGLSPEARALGAPVVLRQKFDGKWPSDHYPVLIDVALNAATRP